ncbi:hypothetical protein F5Y16DRAFT_288864 [Xylariaceae sp. FL0255]|nr:hypothetical protein F5Y16DRAFT_288864 [Xylariaceae sp. FL0255]
MTFLEIPASGLQLDGPPSSRNILPMQAFGITLNDSMIEDMIRCVQKGQDVEIALGNKPSFICGSTEHKISPLQDSIGYDLYLTDIARPGSKTQRLPNTSMSILKKPLTSLSASLANQTKKAVKYTSRASSSGLDSDGDLRDSSSQKTSNGSRGTNNGQRSASKLLPSGRSAMATVLSSSNNRSLPTSPALNGTSSPNPAFSASQQVLEKNKEQRTSLVHALAARDQSFDHLRGVWTGADLDFRPTVEKVADFNKATDTWSLKKIYWKELDVWRYDYADQQERQSAIDNAIKAYDKQRIGTSDAVWERLLPKEERGTGKVLSRLQATIVERSKLAAASKEAAQRTEDSAKSDVDLTKAKGEVMSRSNSQSTNGKSKKPSDREAQAKRLLSNNPKKPVPKKPTSKVKAAEEKGKRVLSEEYVYDSETSGDEAPLSQTVTTTKPKPQQKPAEKMVEKAAERVVVKTKEQPAPSTSLKPKPKPIVRAPRAPVKAPMANKSPPKRPREDDDSSSSSGAPLSKRIKPKELPKPVPEPKPVKHRVSDASQNSRGTNGTLSSSFSLKSKNTSPTKSSPLATTPPTNASDFDERSRPVSQRPLNHSPHHSSRQQPRDRERERDRGQLHGSGNGTLTSVSATSSTSSSVMVSKKRKEREPSQESSETTPTPPTKKPRVAKDVLVQARKFTRYYEKYEVLHHEIAALKDPPEDKLADLLEMRERLVKMKSDIQRAVAAGA